MKKVTFTGVGVSANCEGDDRVIETLDNIKKSGIKSAMITQRTSDFEKQVAYTKDIGIDIPYVHLEFKNANSLWTLGEKRAEYVRGIIDGIKLCKKYNVKIAVMHVTQGNTTKPEVESKQTGLESMKLITKAAEENGVQIAVENTDEIELFSYIMDNINSKNLGFCYDIGHHYLYTPTFNPIIKYGSRCIAVHIHDNMCDWTPGEDWTRDLHALPFSAEIDFEKGLREISKSLYQNVLMLECYRVSYGEPRFHEKLTPTEFLLESKKRAERLIELTQ